MKGDYNELIEEVSSQKWQEFFSNIWDRWFYVIIGTPILVLMSIVGYTIYDNHRESVTMYYSDLYEKGRQNIAVHKIEAGMRDLEEVATDSHSNYAAMARFVLADYFKKQKDVVRQKKQYESLFDNKDIDDFYKYLSYLHWINASLSSNEKNYDKYAQKIDEIINHSSSLKAMALEAKGYIFYLKNDLKKARDIYVQIVQMDTADQGLRDRALAVVRLLSLKVK